MWPDPSCFFLKRCFHRYFTHFYKSGILLGFSRYFLHLLRELMFSYFNFLPVNSINRSSGFISQDSVNNHQIYYTLKMLVKTSGQLSKSNFTFKPLLVLLSKKRKMFSEEATFQSCLSKELSAFRIFCKFMR